MPSHDPLPHDSSYHPRLWLRPVAGCALFGTLVALATALEPIPLADRIILGLGLVATYATVGALVALLPRRGHPVAFGLLVGALYSVPGALFTATPMPLRDDANPFYRSFAGGGLREALATTLFGLVAGLIAGLLRPRDQARGR